MTLVAVIALAVLAVATVVLAPILLSLGRWQVRHPILALAAWKAAIVAGLVAAFAATGVALAAAVDGMRRPEFEQASLTAVAWLSLFALAGAIGLAAATAESWESSEEPAIIGASRSLEVRGETVLVVASDRPIATSLGGRHSCIAVSEGLVELLSERQLEAVVAHERAHIDERHHLLREIACLQAACVPWLPAARRFERSSRLLIELVADEVAARLVGRVHLANALGKMGEATEDATLDLRAGLIASRATSRRARVAVALPLR